jgi:hypothetical protein
VTPVVTPVVPVTTLAGRKEIASSSRGEFDAVAARGVRLPV